MTSRISLSLLHATYRRKESPVAIKEAWLATAVHPNSVEHIFALDADDEMSVASTEGHLRVVSPPFDGVTAVRNWNAAAEQATGDLLIVIADDLLPPPGWDVILAELIGNKLDPRRVPFAVKVSDTPRGSSLPGGDALLRHPIISRAFYEKLGLFSPAFTGIGCDMDFTRRALWRSAIIDGRNLVLDHAHATVDSPSESTSRINAPREAVVARRNYCQIWSARQRAARVRLVRPDVIALTPMMLRVARYWNWTMAGIAYTTYDLRCRLHFSSK